MKIIWEENPLNSKVLLSPTEIEMLRLKIKISELEEYIFLTHWNLKKGDLEKAKSCSDPKYFFPDSDTSGITARVEELLGMYVSSLSDTHIGDCTCIPCSCTKCWAESMLGVDTIDGLHKHANSIIDEEFSHGKTLDEVIASLENFDPTPKDLEMWKGRDWTAYANGWRKDAETALAWLKAYRDKHKSFPATEDMDQKICIDSLINAAEDHATAYEDDDRECIKTDVINAFYAGFKFATSGK